MAKTPKKVVTFGSALSELENAGEVNVKISMHTLEKDGSNVVIKSNKVVCFVLDPPKESKKKKAQTS